MRVLAIAAAAWLLASPAPAADLALVVDDLGYNLERARQVMDLPGPVALGLLPFAPDTQAITRLANASAHEVILHQPMESLADPGAGAMPGTLTLDMTGERFEAQMDAALAAVPGVVGLNNHTGSRLTQDASAMRRLMRYLASRGLLFLDSRTTAATVAYEMAQEASVPALKRDVFLDHVPHQPDIRAEFQRALAIARRQGYAVIIAHPHGATLEFLAVALRALPEGVRLVRLSDLATRIRPAMLVQQRSPESPRRSPGQ